MEFEILGPVMVRRAGRLIPVRSPRQRTLLADALLRREVGVEPAPRCATCTGGSWRPTPASIGRRRGGRHGWAHDRDHGQDHGRDHGQGLARRPTAPRPSPCATAATS